MLYRFHHLSDVATGQLCQVFNDAFSDYVIPMQLTVSLLQQKMAGENIQLDCSAGAFQGDHLCGFILHGRDESRPEVLYNGGTGVVPTARGRHLVQELYAHFVPKYRQRGVREILLEVIACNQKAIRAYENSGFVQQRKFLCFKGEIYLSRRNNPVLIQKSALPEESLIAHFADQVPSWSNSIASVRREKQYTTTWVAVYEGEIVGYISIFLASRRIRQIGVRKDMRRRGIGTALMQQAAEVLGNPFTLINVDAENEGMIAFLEKMGMTEILTQYEMKLSI
ncbi:GNAT family N-acetyltransferase [Chitinophaga sancti]|uniref:GNAT family N-acetyltransferase n=1 Tax=Chitinophaga sancti TaxID=1004 RepID=A0A1K1PBE8_9BACT|nr:GNAT family N-acetyltransferase [Chitinophaga sancti]WQD65736.1 GNAT family N-acetyltransferase [Chitinophaga sancti]WQG88642.1 GNAT family N-acetyltransferase [Chitinophaga sancti]SFW45096.1 Ribosomal protein S18 acetylase RimI [Chitinophaga sancti]